MLDGEVFREVPAGRGEGVAEQSSCCGVVGDEQDAAGEDGVEEGGDEGDELVAQTQLHGPTAGWGWGWGWRGW